MKCTILIPSYNSEKTIKDTLTSCVQQTYKDIEILIVNDHSTDKSIDMIQQFLVDNRFKLLNTPVKLLNTPDGEKGIVAALNHGLKNATGDLIARLDADDMMQKNRIELQVIEFIKNSELLLCSTDAIIINENNEKLPHTLISCDDINDLDYNCNIIHPSVMFRKNYFIENNLFYNPDFQYCEDYELWLHLKDLNKNKNNYYKRIAEPLTIYRVGDPERISVKNKDIQFELSKKAIKKYNISPYLSIVNLTSKDFIKDCRILNFEIVDRIEDAKGQYIAFNKYPNSVERFNKQIQFLKNNKDHIGCGSFIKTEKGVFYYTYIPSIIESELLKGNLAIEPGTFMFKKPDNLNKTNDFFNLICDLIKYGLITNLQEPLVFDKEYSGIKVDNKSERKKYAKKAFKEIVNIVQINITSDGNISGVDRYLKTLQDNYPSFIRCTQVTLVASSNKFFIDNSNQYHIKFYYTANKTKLEHIYDIFWDNFAYLFVNKNNLIVQSNCFNLYSLLTYLRQKVNFKHICALHCVPYREVIRSDRNKFEKLELLYEDEEKEFPEEPWNVQAVNLADYSIVNTNDAEHYYNRIGFNPKYSVIYNGIEKIGKGNRVWDKKSPFRFIFVGHSSPLKGLDQLFPIIEEVNKTHPIEVHWAGSTDKRLLDIIQEKKLPIISYGVLEPEKLNELYKQVDASLIATACETCSYAAIEALSAELPIIATRAHGIVEIVENVGFLVNMNKKAIIDADMYKAGMIQVIENEELRKEMSTRAAEKFKLYDKDIMVEKMIHLYRHLLGN